MAGAGGSRERHWAAPERSGGGRTDREVARRRVQESAQSAVRGHGPYASKGAGRHGVGEKSITYLAEVLHKLQIFGIL
jgi:hypothetical protein